MVDRYAIRDGYTIRPQPEYFDDDLGGVVWQPDVYGDAGRVAARLGAKRIIDVGAGDGTKLADLHPTFELIGIDFGANVDRSEARFPYISWRRHDLDTEDVLPLSVEELDGAVVVCSDVIEHLRAPHLLLRKLRGALDNAGAVLISTPGTRVVAWRPKRWPASERPPRPRVVDPGIRRPASLVRLRPRVHRSDSLERPDRGGVHDRSATDERPRLARRARSGPYRSTDPTGAATMAGSGDPRRSHPSLRLTEISGAPGPHSGD